ncbi:hypothetical protein CgunFtcFv8_002220 [Champsocephalus gunnari]|uniref:Uncharacterized protein n=1 Tax=Champsocephalus gunnari TaxID=52237 RepID=A0AAN8CM29_CHAGU|nr:hypothetical protein CgunFtcFv8_002220 [Champsocephalus gunnari]
MVRGGSGPADRKRNCRGPFFARSRKDPVRSDLRRGEEGQEGSDPVRFGEAPHCIAQYLKMGGSSTRAEPQRPSFSTFEAREGTAPPSQPLRHVTSFTVACILFPG